MKHPITLLLLAILFSLAVRIPTFNRPFHRDAESMGTLYGILGRNYLRYPISTHLLVPIQSLGPVGADEPKFYAHHPPLVPLFTAGTYAIFGEGDWQTRLVPTLFTAGCAAILFGILRPRAGQLAAFSSALLFAATPIAIRFGGMPDVVNSQLVFFCLLTVAGYLRLHALPSWRTLAITIAPFLFAALSDWPAFYLLPVLICHYVLTKPLKLWGWIIVFGAAGTFIFAGIYAHISLVTGDWTLIARQFLRRSATDHTDRLASYSFLTWLQTGVWRHLHEQFTVPLIALLIVWILSRLAALRSTRELESINTRAAATFAWLLLAWGVVHVLIGRQGVFQHDWWWWPVAPGMAAAAGLGLATLLQPIRSIPLKSSILATFLASFSLWSAVTTIRPAYSQDIIYGGIPQYTAQELGNAIRVKTPADAVALLVENDPDDISIWYYADRPLKMGVWTVADLRRRLTDGRADLAYSFSQACSSKQSVVIFPKRYESTVPELLGYLRTNARERDDQGMNKFFVFDLPK